MKANDWQRVPKKTVQRNLTKQRRATIKVRKAVRGFKVINGGKS